MNKNYLIVLSILLILSITGIIFAEEFKKGIEVKEGQNLLNLSNEFEPIYVQDLVKIYPEISTVTYIDSFGEKYGYVNVFGGIGQNFVVYPNSIYEITTKQNIDLNLK
ncbi:MAG: hypothetical protein ACP5NZ_04130 [Nanobdellota archaeon]